MKKLTKAQVLRMYNDMVNQFGGTRGMRDEGLLDSALSAPFQTYDGFELYPEIEERRLAWDMVLLKIMQW